MKIVPEPSVSALSEVSESSVSTAVYFSSRLLVAQNCTALASCRKSISLEVNQLDSFPQKGVCRAVRSCAAVILSPSPNLLCFPLMTSKRRWEARGPGHSLTDSECSDDVDPKSSGQWQQGSEKEKNKRKLPTIKRDKLILHNLSKPENESTLPVHKTQKTKYILKKSEKFPRFPTGIEQFHPVSVQSNNRGNAGLIQWKASLYKFAAVLWKQVEHLA